MIFFVKTDEEVAVLDKEIIRKRQIGGEVVSLSADEIENLRRLTPPGLKFAMCLVFLQEIRKDN